MRKSLRLFAILIITLCALSAVGIPLVDTLMQHWLVADVSNSTAAALIAQRFDEMRRYLFLVVAVMMAIAALATAVVMQSAWRARIAEWRASFNRTPPDGRKPSRSSGDDVLLGEEVHELLRDLAFSDRVPGYQNGWTQDRLREVLRNELNGNDILVVSNREPYIHVPTPQGIRVQRPASGLVTALEPVMRACSGTWIAHGSGAADRETVDRDDRIAVPPGNPLYRLRRIWLTPEEEAGYYCGLANEGLWPLCHIAHVRPTFRAADWEMYRKINARFADAVVKEAQRADPIVLIQDYHFALLPRMIAKRLPNATIVTFWHIPWPNPEAFAICPWRHELLDGLLGSSILGFHIQFHCNNFLDTVDRLMEARVDRETLAADFGGHRTLVRRYPISLEWPPEPLADVPNVEESRQAVRARHSLPREHAIGVGVDRLDYTKGIEERLRAVARLLELHPRWIGRFTFIQIAAPSRSVIEDYRAYAERVRVLALRINAEHSNARHPPIMLLTEHHEPAAVYEYLRAADLCFVSSLHDGMNLVAKEFVAARDDDSGVLVLSRFAGASRELPEAMIVNPYDADECAAALHTGLTMRDGEKRERMRLMRSVVREFNVHRWAGRILLDVAAIRRRSRLKVSGSVRARA